jgi:hypothetical protein
MRYLAVCILLIACARPVSALPARYTHDGFLFRGLLGFGYEDLSASDGQGTMISLSGFGVGSSLSFGGVVAESIAVHGDLFGSTAFDPNVALNGQHLGEATDSSTSLTAIGAGITYWVMPLNLYLSGTLGLGKADFSREGTSTDADWAFAMQALVGKEFWVGEEWGVGFAAQFFWSKVPIEEETGSGSYLGFNVCFSATYN